MSDGLPLLLPGDPENLLSVDARKRIQRAHIESEKFVWEAEVLIQTRHLDLRSPKAHSLRNDASFKKAKAILSVFRREFSRINLTERQYGKYMRDEIDAASNSLQLSGAQRRLLEAEFFFPEEQPVQVVQLSASRAQPQAVTPKETIATQFQRLRDECRWTIPDLAEAVDISPRQVARHLSGEFQPLPRNMSAYERAFSNHLKRKIVIKENVMKVS
jgi:hypothetical protein